MASEVYDSVNKAFQSTCRVLFGGEIGELDDFKGYLLRNQYLVAQGKISISGKPIVIGADRYSKGSRFISQDEIDFAKNPEAVSINDIKDIDSITRAFGEVFCYAGNKVFGNTKFSEGIDNCTDGFYIYNSHTIVSSKYVAYSAFVRADSEHVFGSNVLIGGHHLLHVIGSANLSRGFECNVTTNSSDMFFCHNCTGCSDVMFSFNLISKNHRIGNLQLDKDKYAAIKKELVGQSREYLKKHKTFHSVYSFAPPVPRANTLRQIQMPKKIRPEGDISAVEGAFRATTRLIFGRELSPIDKYGEFLTHNIEKVNKIATPFGNTAYYSNYWWGKNVPKERMVSQLESVELGEQHIKIEDSWEASLDAILKKIADIAFYSVEIDQQENRNNSQAPVIYGATDCYKVSDSTYSKKCAYCTHTQNCDSLFGCGILMVQCSFCIRSHDCVNCSSCLDLDSCKNCFRSMFCHNCENLQDCMFCFNVKNLKYAIGNMEVGRGKYMQIREKVVQELLARIEKQGDFGFDICSLAEYGRKK